MKQSIVIGATRVKNAATAVQAIRSKDRVFVHGAAATPHRLLDALVARSDELDGVEFTHLHTMGKMKYAEPEVQKSFRVSAFFIGQNLRRSFQPGQVDYIPCFLSEIPQLFRSGRFPIDVALIHVSPPDPHGYCTLGTSVDVAKAATEVARTIIAQVNPLMPRTHGDGFIHINQIHHMVEVDDPLPEETVSPPTDIEKRIATNVASLVEDGSTLQMGIGTIPDAVLAELRDRRHLGIHSEMWTDGTLELLYSGAIDNSLKKIHPGKTVAGFVMGSQKLYQFLNDNPSTVLLDIGYVNSPANIARNPKVVAINSAIEVDLTGQVCADSIGQRIISGAGGQMDFIRGASLSPGGKPIIALPSQTKTGVSRIVCTLKLGSGVVTTRAHAHYVITEYGIADLYGKNLSQRSKALIEIAHPNERENLARAWRELHRY